MRYAILGDIHGNLDALESALAFLSRQEVDRILQVGDVVGYGAEPGACIEAMKAADAVVVAGNHDWAVIGKQDLACFNPAARAAIEWTRARLSRDELAYLESLPLAEVIGAEVSLAHASPDQPEVFDYVLDYDDAQRAMKCFETLVCFIGHSHMPITFRLARVIDHTFDQELLLRDVPRALINVGSVGQPRDGCPLCAVGVYDSEERRFTLHRIPYDIDAAAAKIRAAGLPRVLADRLYVGR